MTPTSSMSTAIAVTEPAFTHQEQLALAGFLAGILLSGWTAEDLAAGIRRETAAL